MPENILYQKHNGFSKDKVYRPSYRSQEMAEYDYKIMCIDPSGRGKDEMGVVILYHLNSKLFAKKILGLQGGYENDNLVMLAELCDEHEIDTVVIESNWADGMFNKMLEPHLLKISPKTEIEEFRVTGQKEARIIDSLEPIFNQHRLVIDKEVFEHDLKAAKRDYSFTYQLSHLTRERDSLKHDDRIDALSIAVSFMIEWMSDSDDRGMDYHIEKEAEKALEYSLQFAQKMGGRREKKHLNYASGF